MGNLRDKSPTFPETYKVLEWAEKSIGKLYHFSPAISSNRKSLYQAAFCELGPPVEDQGEPVICSPRRNVYLREDMYLLFLGCFRLSGEECKLVGISGHLDVHAAKFLVGEKLLAHVWAGPYGIELFKFLKEVE